MPLNLLRVFGDEDEPSRPQDAEADHRIANSLAIIAGLIRSEERALAAGGPVAADDVKAPCA